MEEFDHGRACFALGAESYSAAPSVACVSFFFISTTSLSIRNQYTRCHQTTVLPSEKYLVGFNLHFLDGHLSSRLGLHVRIKLVEFLHTEFPCRGCRHSGTEFLKVPSDPVESKTGSAVRTLNPGHEDMRRTATRGEASAFFPVPVLAAGSALARAFRGFFGIAGQKCPSNRSAIQIFPHVLQVFFSISTLIVNGKSQLPGINFSGEQKSHIWCAEENPTEWAMTARSFWNQRITHIHGRDE